MPITMTHKDTVVTKSRRPHSVSAAENITFPNRASISDTMVSPSL